MKLRHVKIEIHVGLRNALRQVQVKDIADQPSQMSDEAAQIHQMTLNKGLQP